MNDHYETTAADRILMQIWVRLCCPEFLCS